MSGQPGHQDVHPWLPDPDWAPLAPFWSAARDGHLAFPQCTTCMRFQWYPQDMCPSCRTLTFRWTEVEARGHVFSHTVLRRSFMPEFAGRTPLMIVLVKFTHVPGVTLVTNVLDPPSGGVRIDDDVVIEFPDVGAGLRLPMARVVNASA